MSFKTYDILNAFILFNIYIISAFDNCLDKPVSILRKIPTEDVLLYESNRNDSFHEYLKLVYGEVGESNDYSDYDFDMYYERTDIEFRISYPRRNKVNLYADSNMLQYISKYEKKPFVRPYKDNEWVEVQRAATKCYPWGADEKYTEGLSKGFPEYPNYFEDRKTQPYGCWFYMLTGTGIYINIGKTIFATSRKNAFDGVHMYRSVDGVVVRPWRALCSRSSFHARNPLIKPLLNLSSN